VGSILAAGCADHPQASPSRCQAPAGVSAAPGSVAEMVALVNALPAPVALNCVLESLQRPLHVTAVNSFISLQPSRGRRSPRVFLASGKLITSIAPEGAGRELMEFGEFVDETRTVKAEIHFPVEGPLAEAEAFQRIRDARIAGTSCRFCHANEQPADELKFHGGFVSSAIRPGASTLIDLEWVREQHQTCDARAEPERCAFFRALFDHGEVRAWEFPEVIPTFTR
jgi:hypothetical protein